MNYSELYESQVKSYCRSFPCVFDKAKGSFIFSDSGDKYIDFFDGAGALNYGHNNDYIKDKVIDYLSDDGIIHALDMFTAAKESFLEKFHQSVLSKLGDYKVQFCGPTGTNANEAALKLARKITGRTTVFAFTGSFHGMSLGSMSVTSGVEIRNSAGVPLDNVVFMPYCAGSGFEFDTLDYMENILNDDHSGVDIPAAVIFETVQAEGGINVADIEWLKRLEHICEKYGILTICDEIQVGCGRTGDFYSFERAGIHPDLISSSKSISGYGFPMSILLIKSKYDIWEPAEHNGTFRGNQIAFVSAKAALEFREKNNLKNEVERKAVIISDFLEKELLPLNSEISFRGIGMIWGVDFSKIDATGELTHIIASDCFKKRLIIERAGRHDTVLKIMPALTIEDDVLLEGLEIIKASAIDSLTKIR
jgi:diaminobutyrate-2-oxoglutarate transaminase